MKIFPLLVGVAAAAQFIKADNLSGSCQGRCNLVGTESDAAGSGFPPPPPPLFPPPFIPNVPGSQFAAPISGSSYYGSYGSGTVQGPQFLGSVYQSQVPSYGTSYPLNALSVSESSYQQPSLVSQIGPNNILQSLPSILGQWSMGVNRPLNGGRQFGYPGIYPPQLNFPMYTQPNFPMYPQPNFPMYPQPNFPIYPQPNFPVYAPPLQQQAQHQACSCDRECGIRGGITPLSSPPGTCCSDITSTCGFYPAYPVTMSPTATTASPTPATKAIFTFHFDVNTTGVCPSTCGPPGVVSTDCTMFDKPLVVMMPYDAAAQSTVLYQTTACELGPKNPSYPTSAEKVATLTVEVSVINTSDASRTNRKDQTLNNMNSDFNKKVQFQSDMRAANPFGGTTILVSGQDTWASVYSIYDYGSFAPSRNPTATTGSPTATPTASTRVPTGSPTVICTACPSGQYASTPCDQSKSISRVCSTCTTSCGVNRFVSNVCNAINDLKCEMCPIGKESLGGTTSTCTDCPTGTVTFSPGHSCTACQYNQYVNGTSCIACPSTPANCLSSSCSSSTVVHCDVPAPGYKVVRSGQFVSDTLVLITNSPTASPTVKPTFGCNTCGTGQFVQIACDPNSSRQTQCSTCSQCPLNHEVFQACSATSDTQCTPCPVGQYSQGGNTGCIACPSGFTSHAGSNCYRPNNCAVGQYNNSFWGVCTSCPPITNCNQVTCTSASDRQCQICATGFYRAVDPVYPHVDICSSTPPPTDTPTVSTQSPTLAPFSCNICTSGQYPSTKCDLSTRTQVSCATCTASPCPAHSFQVAPCTSNASTGSDLKCSFCPAGTDNAAQASTCTACPAGKFSAGNGKACQPCIPGEYNSGSTASPVCSACTAITNCAAHYCTTVADQECLTCNPGHVVSSNGQSCIASSAPTASPTKRPTTNAPTAPTLSPTPATKTPTALPVNPPTMTTAAPTPLSKSVRCNICTKMDFLGPPVISRCFAREVTVQDPNKPLCPTSINGSPTVGCMTVYAQDINGNVDVAKHCATKKMMEDLWRTSPSLCSLPLAQLPTNQAFKCNYGCVGEMCNSGHIPPQSSWYTFRNSILG